MRNRALIQTAAIFTDAYRELNSNRLFWGILALSAFVVVAFATVGLYDQGLTINVLVARWEIPAVGLNSGTIGLPEFYKMIFMTLGVKLWLTQIAAILALISTSSMMPDFISGGAIELTLSKPISRTRLFLTKYVAGLLFVTLQVLAFSGSAFLLIGIKAHSWDPSILLSVPIVVVFFSYIYCVSTLLGLLTRSTVTTLLLTILIWLVVFFGVGTAENVLLEYKDDAARQVERMEQGIESRQKIIDAIESGKLDQGALKAVLDRMTLERRREAIEEFQADLESQRRALNVFTLWHRGLYIAKTLLPKTKETVDLLNRQYGSIGEYANRQDMEARRKLAEPVHPAPTVTGPDGAPLQIDTPTSNRRRNDAERAMELRKKLSERTLWWVIGTSLGFEAVILLLAAWIFARRDF